MKGSGKENSVIDYETSEQLDIKPAEYFLVVNKREKRACKTCEEQGVECAQVPVRIIEKGLASDRAAAWKPRQNHPFATGKRRSRVHRLAAPKFHRLMAISGEREFH